jgi:hypothetical protein
MSQADSMSWRSGDGRDEAEGTDEGEWEGVKEEKDRACSRAVTCRCCRDGTD